MKFTLLQLFSLVDGRLSTNMGDVYTMLNYLTSQDLHTLELPWAMREVEAANPEWFQVVSARLAEIKQLVGSDDFELLIEYIKTNCPDEVYELCPLS